MAAGRGGGRRRKQALKAAVLLMAAAIVSVFLAVAAFAAEAPVIRGGSELDFRPYAFTDADGQPTGFGVELLKAVAEKMGLRLQIITGPWDTVWNGLVAGRIDVLPVVARTPGREPLVDFSLPHTETFDAFFVREGRAPIKDLAAAAGKEIVVLRSDAAHHHLVERKFAGTIVPVDSISEGLRMIAAGKHDAMLCSRLVGMLERDQAGIKGVTPGSAIADYKREFSFAVRKGNAELVEQLNQGLLMVKGSGEYERIYQKWLSVDDPWRRYKEYVAPVLVVLLSGLVVSGCWLLLLRRLVRKRTAQLAKANRVLEQERAELEGKVLKRTEDLSRSEARLKSFSEATFEGIVRSDAGRVVDCNNQFAEMTGYTVSELKGFAIVDMTTPEDRQRVLENIRENRESTIEHSMVRKDGTRIVVEAHGRPVEPGSVLRHTAVRDITERKRAEEALRQNEEKYRNLFENMAEEVHFWQLERDEAGHIRTWRLVDANPPTLKTWGRQSIEEIRGKTTDEIFGPGATEHYMAVVRKIMDEGVPYSFEDYFPHLDKHFRFTSVPLGERFITTGADVTAIKKAETALRESEARSAYVVKLTDALRELADADRIKAAAACVLGRHLGASRVAYVEVTPEGDVIIEQAYADGVAHIPGRYRLDDYGTELLPELWAGRNIVVADVENATGYSEQEKARYQAVQVVANLNVPLVKDGHLVALLAVHQSVPRRWTGEEVRFTEETAARTWAAVMRARAEQALRHSEERFQLSMEATSDGLWDWNAQTDVVYYSPSYFRILGYEPGGFPSTFHAWKQMVHPGDLERTVQVNMDCVEGRTETFAVEYRMKTRTGEWRWILGRGKCIARDAKGRAVRLIGTHVDISERKRAEEALRKAHDELELRVAERTKELEAATETLRSERQRFYDVLETLPSYVVLLTHDYHVAFANRVFRQRFGESGGKRCYEFLFNRNEPCETCETFTVLKTNAPHHWEWAGPDGRDYDVYDYPFVDSDGSTLILEMGIDTTEQKEAHHALRELTEAQEQRIIDRTAELASANETLRASRVAALNLMEDALEARRRAEAATVELLHEVAARRQSEEQLRLFVEYAPAAIAMLDCDMKYLGASRRWYSDYGIKQQDIISRSHYEVFPDIPEAWKNVHRRCLDGAIERREEDPWVRADGHIDWVRWEIRPWYRGEGEVGGLIIFSENITEIKLREEELRRLNRTLAALGKSSHALTRAGDEAPYLDEVCRIIVEDCGHAMVWIGYAEDDDAKTVRPVAYSGFEAGYLESLHITWADTERGHGPTGTAIRTGRPSGCPNILTDPRFAPWRDEAIRRGYASSIVVPLQVDGKIFGALNIYSRQPYAFSEAEVELLSDLAADLAYGITSLRLRAAHARAEAALRETEQRFRAMFERHKAIMLLIDPESGALVDANPSAVDFYGYSYEELREMTITDINQLPPDDVARELRDTASEGRGYFTFPHKLADGRVRWVEVYTSPLMTAGRRLLFSIIHDITERKKAEEALRVSENRFRAIFESSSDCILVFDGQYNYLYANQAAIDHVGTTRDKVVGRNIRDGLGHIPDFMHLWMGRVERAFATGESFRVEDAVRVGGRIVHSESQVSPIRDASGQVFAVGVVYRDVTERRLAEEALRESEGELRRAQEALQRVNEDLEQMVEERTEELKHANLDLRKKTRDLNERVKELNCLNTVFHLLTEEDMPMEPVLQKVAEVIPSGLQFPETTGVRIILSGIEVKTADFRDRPWALEKPIPVQGAVEGSIAVACCEEPLGIRAGRFLREEEDLIGTIAKIIGDFIQRLRSRAMLEESEARYRGVSRQLHALLDALPDMLILLSSDLKIVWANKAAAERAGVASEALVGQPCRDFWAGLGVNGDTCPAKSCFESGQRTMDRLGSTDGTFWDAMAIPIKDEAGTVRNAILVARDVTRELRLQEEAVRSARLASLGELAAGVAHEINNPVNAVINYAQILVNGAATSSREHEFAGEIIREGERIAGIVRGLLGFARDLRDVRHPVTLRSVLDACLTLTGAQLRRDGIKLRIEAAEDLPLIRVNQQQLQQVFLNLISNARYALNKKYQGPHEGKTLDIRGRRRTVEGKPHVRIEVRDHGTGIPKDLQHKVAAPFFTTKPSSEGTGLGLSISSSILADHGGRLTLESVEGEWTSVVIDLPAETPGETHE